MCEVRCLDRMGRLLSRGWHGAHALCCCWGIVRQAAAKQCGGTLCTACAEQQESRLCMLQALATGAC